MKNTTDPHNEDDTPELDDKAIQIEGVLQEVRGILLERLEGEFQIIWTGYDDEIQETRTHTRGYGNLHARLSACEMWVRRTREQLADEDECGVTFTPWEDETGEPE